MKPYNFLTIAGSDSGGGAGIQADLKTATMLGGFGTSAITALTAQNTCGVNDIHPVPLDFIAAQLTAILSDIDIHVIKSGMLFNADIINVIAQIIPDNVPYILDTVMIAKGGALLLQENAIEAMKQHLFHKALLITPNLPELEALSGGISVTHAQNLIRDYGCQNVLIKGGHDTGYVATDILVTPNDIYKFSLPRIVTKAGHGTGCTLSSAIACYIAQGLVLNDAVDKAKKYVYEALKSALPIGNGHHPLNHNYSIQSLTS
ncbi:MAG: hydroxymethylpyrimidine kinase/phosphomethylpyrimidine kinase [Alphaproteobacteria bacterium]